MCCPGDVTSPAAVERAVAAADADGRLSLCVNAAGTNAPGPTAELPLADWDVVLDTNLRGTFLVCQAFGRMLLARRSGRIVTCPRRWARSATRAAPPTARASTPSTD